MIISGSELAGFIKQRHYEQARALKPTPQLVIVQVGDDAATASYVRAKQRYGDDIGVAVEHCQLVAPTTEELVRQIKSLNDRPDVAGIIVQLPLPTDIDTDVVLASISPAKDIDGLGPKSDFDTATPTAIMWLLGGYNVDVKGKTAVVVGQGRLVGQGIAKILTAEGANVVTCDINTTDLAAQTLKADILITATGVAGLIKPGMVREGTVIIDAGTSEASGKLMGDVDPVLYDDPGIRVSPTPGGVGPMTVAVLFENLLRAGGKSTDK